MSRAKSQSIFFRRLDLFDAVDRRLAGAEIAFRFLLAAEFYELLIEVVDGWR